MSVTSRDNWTFGAQLITAAGMFLVTLGILFIATLTYLGREDQEFRNEIRAELSAIRSEMHDMNTRLGRIEGYLRVPDAE